MSTKRLLIKNLGNKTTRKEIELFFSAYGGINFLKLKSSRGYALIEMSSSREARRAQKALNGSCIWGRVMEINEMSSLLKWNIMNLL